MKILTVFGTRPEVIKMAPVIRALTRHGDHITHKVCVTGQHQEMLDPLLKVFGIQPDFPLAIMRENQTLTHLTTAVLTGMERVLDQYRPDYVLVQGDTTTGMAAALAAFYRKIAVGHIEAGLRTFNKYHPFPEEVNRRVMDSVAEAFFAHTPAAREHLLKEGVDPDRIAVTGNTGVDALLWMAARETPEAAEVLRDIPSDKKWILLTTHRRESFGRDLENILMAVKELAERYASSLHFVYPVHLNPRVQEKVRLCLEGVQTVSLLPPLDYPVFVHLMKRSHLILTDSGGIQEEAPSLNVPVLVLRRVTERQEAVEAGAVRLVGVEKDAIIGATVRLLEDERDYRRMAAADNPYGDGRAAERIVQWLLKDSRRQR